MRRQLGALAADALEQWIAAVRVDHAVFELLRAAAERRTAGEHARIDRGVAEAVAALVARLAGLSVGLARIERPEAAAVARRQLLPGDVEPRVRRVHAARRVDVERRDPEALRLIRRLGELVAVRA